MGSDFTWKPISGFFKEFKKYNPEIFPAPLSSPLMMNKVAEVIMKSGYDLSWMGSGLENIAAGYTFWQSQPNRTVYVAKKETASFPDGIFVFSIKADQFKINADLAKTGKLLDTEMYGDLDGFPERRLFTKGENQKALKVLQFVFAASYYIESAGKKDGVTTKHLKLGPAFESPSSEEKPGKKKKRKGKTLPVRAWTYATLSVDREVMDNKGKEQGEGRKLNTDDLTLFPVIVSPHIRRMSDDRIILVDAYESHRWKSEEKVGKKIKI